mgnify:FL=1
MGFVMSIDTGNKMMKTNHFIFHSGIKRKEQKILPGEEGIFFKGINYLESNQRISYLEDKTIDDRYYILTLLGVAKELEKEGIETGIHEGGTIPIQLLVGLPPGDYGKQIRKFREYFWRQGKNVYFSYKGKPYRIRYESVKVYMQGYSAYILVANQLHLQEQPKVLLIDIGGFTVDYLLVRYGVVDRTRIDSLPEGIIMLYKRIMVGIRQRFNLYLEEIDIDNILFKRKTPYSELVIRRTFEIAAEYMSDLLGSFLEFGIDFRTTVTVFVGGGTVLLKDIIDEVWKRYHSTYYVLDDPKANVKGFIKQYMAEKAGY